MKKINPDVLKKVGLTAAIVLVLVLSSFLFGNPNITGYLSLDLVMENVDLTVDQSQGFTLSIQSTKPFILTSFKIAGEVVGDGIAEAYIDNGRGQQFLVYRNVMPIKRGMNLITGLVVTGVKLTEQATAEKGSYLLINPGNTIQDVQFQPLEEDEETVSGGFRNECVDTCFIKMEMSSDLVYKLIVKTEPGTSIKIDNVFYTIDVGE